jgi:hypothetical protein
MYAIVQEIDGKDKFVCGPYTTYEEGESNYLNIMILWYNDKYHAKNAPKFVKLEEMTIIHSENSDELQEIKQIYQTYHEDTQKNDDEQYNKAVELKKNREEKIRSTILHNFQYKK